MEQLALDLGIPAAPPETVISRSNEDAYRILDDWPRWPHPIVMVRGPRGSGKTHLAHAFADLSGGLVVPGPALTGENAVAIATGPVAVDDIENVDEQALFHLINAVRAANSTLLLTGTTRANIRLADLASRLRAVPEVALDAPDDALLRRVLLDAFIARQLPADPAVVTFLMARMERTLHAACQVVEEMDKTGLAERRPPTRPLAARVLRESGSPSDNIVP
ncbi:hypothetical protein L1787_13920 [Acuticoccus sp. M5D2P5]|uniref:hypothetical protein n=1 Tax=Acuticoccus kalidii TaxID=2910977 RepID=UPI001F1F855E|nr:hypothetical protein [Acuticoccus kalidii]MCF3934502.1 hypothetical protein [Acuticoccus kalidii]